MKKLKILLLALAATISVGAWADVPTDGVYYLKSVTTGKYVSRGSNWNTRAIVDDWGVAVQVTTEGENTTCKFVDSNLNLFATDNDDVFTDNASTNIQWTLQETTNGFKFKNVNKETYIVLVEDNNFMNLHQGEELSAESFTFEPTSEHPAKMAALYETTKAGVFTAAGVDASKLSTDYAAKSITVSDPVSSVAEQYQGCGTIKTQTLSGLKNGLYKVTVNAFHRITGNDATYTAYQGGYASPVVYLFANDMKYQIHSVMDEPATAKWDNGDYNKDGKYYPNNMPGASNAFKAGKYLNEAWVYVTDGNLTFGLQNDSKVSNGNWTCYQNFTVTYYTDEVSEEDAEAILESVPTGKMASSVSTALNTAEENFKTNKNVANYNALATAIANANASIADYAKLKAAIDLAKKYTVVNESYTELGTAITTAEGIYNDGTVESCTETITNLDNAVKAAKVADYTYVSSTYKYLVELGTWSETGSTGKMTGQHWSGDNKREYLEQSEAAWGWNSWSLGYSQDVTLPAGNYVFKVAGRKAPGDGCTLSLVVKKGEDVIGAISNFPDGDTGLGINKAGATSFDSNDEAGFANNNNGRGFQWRYVKFTLAEGAKVNVAVTANATTSHQWVSFCDATIQTDNEANIAMIAYNIALNDAKLAKENNAYKNVTGAELTALNTAIAFETAGKTKEQIEEATTALQEATTAFKEAAPAYDNYVAVLEKVKNLDDAGKAKFAELTAEIKAKYDNNTICKADLVNVTDFYFAAVKAQTTIGSDWSGLIVNSSFEETTDVWNNGWTTDRNTTGNFDYKLLEESATDITDGKYVLNAWASQINYIRVSQSINLPVGVYELSAAVYSDLVKDQHIEAIVNDNHYKSAIVDNNKWEILSTQFIVSEEGDVTIGIYSNGNNKDGDHYGWFRVDNFKLKYCGPVKSANMAITDAKWGTFCAPFDVTIPDGVKAYTAEQDDNTVAFTEVETTIPAGTPVVVYSAETVDKNYFGVLNTEETCTEGALVGVYAAKTGITAETGHTNYVLQNNSNVVGFYKATSAISLKANRCYMTLATSAGAKDCIGLDGVITGINNILNPTDKSVEGIFDLNGRKLAAPQKGINIINGVKVIVK